MYSGKNSQRTRLLMRKSVYPMNFLSCLLIRVNMQVHSCNQKGNQSQGDFAQRIYMDDVLYICSSRFASRIYRASSDEFV